MNKTEALAQGIMDAIEHGRLKDPNLLASFIKEHWNEACKVVKNINTTSVSESDRTRRIIEFEANYGLSKTHII